MPASEPRVGYVLKMYPRFSETFILREILAHEAAGLELDVFSLRPPADGRFHEGVAHVRADVVYLDRTPKSADLWAEICATAESLPRVWPSLREARGEDALDVYQALQLARSAKARGIEHLHAHFGSVATSVARLAAQMAGITYSFTAHAKDIFHESVREEDLRRKLAGAAGVVTVSQFNVRHLRDSFGAAADRVECVYNGLDLGDFEYSPPTDRSPTIVAVGRLVEKKGFADLVDACRILKDRGRIYQCEIVGSGQLDAELHAQVERLDLDDVVTFAGPVPQHELGSKVGEAAVLAAPCVVGGDGNADGLPTVLLEAMAFGTPCVATDVTGIPEVIQDGVTGVLVPQHDPPALAGALEQLLDDRGARVHLATNARRLIEEAFDIHRTSARIRELFADAAARAELKAA